MEHTLKSHCSKKHLREIRTFVEKVLKSHKMPDIEAYQIILAVDEICANLIIHSHQCNEKETFEVKINYNEDEEITFEIIDDGLAFALKGYSEPDLQEIIKTKKKGGLGLMLVQKIMDSIEFRKKNKKTVCFMCKKLHS
ncbi:MAG: ATP-binding protein [Cyclobacteriaceae bacterium]